MNLLPQRLNAEMARLVEIALEIQISYGAHAAANFLTAYGAGFRLTVRVLSEPRRRRK
jgi:hypothetical protein